MIDNQEIKERFVLVAAVTDDGRNLEESMHELTELTKTAGAEAVGRVVQMRESIHPGTYIGKGKIEEVRETINALDATGIICDDDLSPAQYNNLADMLDVKVMDRTMLILDIFAGRARTSEGKIQVELAQLRYRSARLTGIGRSMSRLCGGIGTRGPGEKKLEMVRRLIGKRISSLKEELAEVKRHRELVRARRREGKEKTCAIVGYTNSGKSTLLNVLCDADVYVENQLFATLDPSVRRLVTDEREVLLVD
ncbi:MAG: GTPase HflX, partial [Lachnospiraceae bacterium]|nr:GTPase HflX [Lachnospiraceae bacterium]